MRSGKSCGEFWEIAEGLTVSRNPENEKEKPDISVPRVQITVDLLPDRISIPIFLMKYSKLLINNVLFILRKWVLYRPPFTQLKAGKSDSNIYIIARKCPVGNELRSL